MGRERTPSSKGTNIKKGVRTADQDHHQEKWGFHLDWLAASLSPPPPTSPPTTRAPRPLPRSSALTHQISEARMFTGLNSTSTQRLGCLRTDSSTALGRTSRTSTA